MKNYKASKRASALTTDSFSGIMLATIAIISATFSTADYGWYSDEVLNASEKEKALDVVNFLDTTSKKNSNG